MRSLLKFDKSSDEDIKDDCKPCGCGKCFVCKVFGSHAMSNKEITRILVRDCPITEKSETILRTAQEEKGINFAGIKSENIINRKTGMAADKGLRTQETVPAGTEFKLEITVKLFNNDDKTEVINFVKKGLDLLQKDYLGSAGSRGYGKIRIDNLEIKDLN
jgi:CRISPR-associated protein Csm3